MNKIARNFAAATLSLSALFAAPGFATETARLTATPEEMTKPNALGHTIFSKNSTVFSACTSDNYRVTSHFFLAADSAAKITLSKDNEPAKKMIKLFYDSFSAEYSKGAAAIPAADFAEDIRHSTVPLLLRQYMNAMTRTLNSDGTTQVSWQLRNTTISNARDPACNVPPKNVAVR
jgi:hypothetical protein